MKILAVTGSFIPPVSTLNTPFIHAPPENRYDATIRKNIIFLVFLFMAFPYDCVRVTAEVFTMSSMEHPLERSLIGFAKPWRNGP